MRERSNPVWKVINNSIVSRPGRHSIGGSGSLRSIMPPVRNELMKGPTVT
jgi:hypothetical protein